MLKKTERRCRLEPIGSGCDGNGDKHPLGLVEGATENTTVVQALIDNLIERGLDPKVCRLFIIDGAKALSKVIRRTFGAHTPIQRCQIHKARNVIERLPKPLHASVRRALRQAWELDDAKKGRVAAAQPRPQARQGSARRRRQHPRRSRRDVDCQSTEGESRMAELLDHPFAADTIWFVRPSRYASAFSARDNSRLVHARTRC
jgi:hypothetical protein